MFLTSGVRVSQELTDAFGAAVDDANVRFLKVAVHNQFIVPVDTIGRAGPIDEDLNKLQDILQNDAPAYVLVRLDDGKWLAVFYIPDTAKESDKALYASSRIPLTNALGSAHFIDSLYATSKANITLAAYESRKRGAAVLKSSQEGATDACEYEGRVASATLASARCKGFPWGAGAEEAVASLANGEEARVVLLTIEPSSELVQLACSKECTVDQLGSTLPVSDPCYAFFAWPRTASRREIILIYSCPDSTPLKQRMLYSTNAGGLFRTARQLPAFAPGAVARPTGGARLVFMLRRVETTDPREVDEAFLRAALGLDDGEEAVQMERLPGMDEKAFY